VRQCQACSVSASAGTPRTSRCFGFSRALVAGDRVLVAGTAPVPPGGGPPPSGPYAQARLCLDLIGAALGPGWNQPGARGSAPAYT